MKNHYIPCLLLKQFATAQKVHSYDVISDSFSTKKIKNTYIINDAFPPELEKAFASKLEGPFGDLLNHKLLAGDTILIDRKENLLMRKFLMIQFLRAPIVNASWDEMVERTGMQNHTSVQLKEFLSRHTPGFKEVFEKSMPSKDTYLSDLEKAMEINSLEEIANPNNSHGVSSSLQLAAMHAMTAVIAFWDCTETGQEFILPKLPGISQMDQISIFHKMLVIRETKFRNINMSEIQKRELDRLEYSSALYSDNYSIYPLSPTRALICFSPYFRAFFPIMDDVRKIEMYPPFLSKEQFDRHFYESMRLELFRPCKNMYNLQYQYSVKKLLKEEVLSMNAMMLKMETEEFVFHDYDKIREALEGIGNKRGL